MSPVCNFKCTCIHIFMFVYLCLYNYVVRFGTRGIASEGALSPVPKSTTQLSYICHITRCTGINRVGRIGINTVGGGFSGHSRSADILGSLAEM